jgi:hypothetical protein
MAILPSADPTNFTPVDDLTKEQIVTWIENNDNVDDKIALSTSQLEEQLNPTHVNITPNF